MMVRNGKPTAVDNLPAFLTNPQHAELIAAMLEMGVNAYKAQAVERDQTRLERANVSAGEVAVHEIATFHTVEAG